MAGGYPPPGPNQQQPNYQQQPQGQYQPPPQGYPPQQGYAQPMAYPPGMADPNAPYGIDPKTGLPFSDKQKIVAGLLQIFLGGFGAGRFYTGHTGIAIWQIVATWLTCGAGALWPLIDGIMMLTGSVTDAQGRPLRD
ncbi:MAG: TM2 domain-containing protein [Planctomycetes bacterium]|nr:TM2 domain-containing protein [Planctomycetota bacterium]